MTPPDARTNAPHLFSAVISFVLVGAILWTGRTVAIQLEQRALPAVASEPFSLKNQGLAFQRAAARAPDILPIYGSSELIKPIPEKSSDFFRAAPTGFQVSPVGKPGTTSIIILQKIGALGADFRDRNLAISISPSWFFMPVINPHFYEGNFSLLAASEMVFGNTLDFKLKRDIAARMLQFPDTFAKNPLLEFALGRLASGTWFDRVIFYALWPMGKVQNAVLDWQDHFESLVYVLRQTKPAVPHRPETLDWSKLIAAATEAGTRDPEQDEEAPGPETWIPGDGGDATFLARMESAREWIDFELLLRGLAEMHVRPLLLSMPIDGSFYDRLGISRQAREAYYNKVRALAQRYNVPAVEFEEHDDDPAFLTGHHYHLTARGWMFYNRALDDFFHGRSPGNPTKS